MKKIKNKDRIVALEMLIKSEVLKDLTKDELVESLKKILYCCPSDNSIRLFQNAGTRIKKIRRQL